MGGLLVTLLVNPMTASGDAYTGVSGDQLVVGQEVLPRRQVNSVTVGLNASGNLRLTHFTARKTGTVTQVRAITGSTAAAATPTLARIGIYLEAADGGLTLVGATANDTTLFAATATTYTRSLAAACQVTQGRRYAFGILVVTAAALPTFAGIAGTTSGGLSSAELAIFPRLNGNLAGQTDLPSTIATGSVAASGTGLIYGALLP